MAAMKAMMLGQTSKTIAHHGSESRHQREQADSRTYKYELIVTCQSLKRILSSSSYEHILSTCQAKEYTFKDHIQSRHQECYPRSAANTAA
jgi:hypothetical protein